ncbi:MAG: selenium-dependent xanthine dehydrogenase [Opitutales bacterium]
MELSLNGASTHYAGDPKRSLLDYLRADAGLTSPKRGCENEAACGCCKVLVNGKSTYACVTPMSKVEGKTVTTLEGISQERRQQLVEAFTKKGGVQCGFCLPGITLDTYALLERDHAPSRAAILKSLDPHLCRCTGYAKLADSIEAAAALWRGESLAETGNGNGTNRGGIGQPLPKYTGGESVLGDRPFVDDLTRPGLLHAALCFSEHPRQRIDRLNTSKARAMAGVIGVLTARDIPGARVTGLIEKDWPMLIAEGETTRYVGDVLALVVAETVEQARHAAAAIEVVGEVLEPLTDVFAALEPDAPRLHAKGNVLSSCATRRGDAEKALESAAFVSRGRYTTQRIEHAFMEPESCLAAPVDIDGGDGVCLYSQGQGVYEDRKGVAAILGLPEEQVRVVQVQAGGGFGGKEDLTVQGHAALAAWLLRTPVKLTLTRSESIRMHPKRHPFVMDYEVGCDESGKLTAVRAKLYADTGAYASVGMKVVERAVGHATGAYDVPAVDVEGFCVYTNNIPSGAMRGFGVNQVTFALEACLDDLCRQGGFDRWQLRYDNALCEGSMTATGQRLGADAAGLRQTLEAVREDYRQAPFAGLACAIKNTGVGNGMPDIGRARIEIVSEKRIQIFHGWTEMGQGVHNMALQTFCEETGLPPEIVEVKVDTREQALCGMTTSSRGTALVGNAVIAGCKTLKEDLAQHGLAALVGKAYLGEWICDWTSKPGKVNAQGEHHTHFSYGFATQLAVLNAEGQLERIVSANDAGRIMNPMLFEGQVEGAVHMGLGYALSEDLPMKDGIPETTKLRRLGLLKASQMPPVEVRGVEVPAQHGPYGAKGVGEIGLVPTAAAVAGALTARDGQPRHSLPLNESHILPGARRS